MMLGIPGANAIENVPAGQKPLGSAPARAARDEAAGPLVTQLHAVGARAVMDVQHPTLMPQTEPIEVPSPQRRPTPRKPRRAPTPPLCDATPAEMMKILTLDGEWRTMGRSPLAAANELLDGDEPVDDCAVCGGSLFQPADDDEGPFAMSPPKLSPRVVCRCPPVLPGG